MTKLLDGFVKLGVLTFICVLAFSANTYAQEDDAEKVEKTEEAVPVKKKFEKVQVTGSRIRRTDFEGPTPVKIVNRKDLEDSPYNSVGDYFRDLTVSAFGSARENSGSSVAGSSSVNIRGIGSTNTLVLLNGVRLQPNGISGAVDLNLIPQIAIESSEILKSGASAIYGSDALGGVVNLQTRKNFTGAEFSGQVIVPEDKGGERIDFSVIGGKQFKNSSVTIATQYRNNKFIMARDRNWSRAGSDGNNGWSNLGITPAYQRADGKWALRPADMMACKSDSGNQLYRVDSAGNEICRFAWANQASNIPEIEQYSAYANYNLKMDSRTHLDIVAMYSQQNTSWIYAPTPAVLKVSKEAVTAWGVFTPDELASMPADNVNIRYRLKEGGNRISDLTSNAYNGVMKFEREFGEAWTYLLNLGFGLTKTNDVSSTGYYKQDALNRVLSSGAFNPFDPTRTAAQLGNAPFQPFQNTQAINYFADTSVTGELMELPNGQPLSIATGLQYNHLYYTTESDPETAKDNSTGGAGSNGGGNRDIASTYLEVSVPLIKNLEANLAARFDWFSDYGTAFSPQAAVKYAPARSLLFRGSIAKGYKAPLMQELYATGGVGFPSFIDQVACEEGGRTEDNIYCSSQQYKVTSQAPGDLDAEEAVSYNLGFVYEPIKGLSIVVDGWYADISNVIGVSNEQITQAQLEDQKNGNTANEQILNDNGIVIKRDADGKIEELTVPTQNLSSRTQSGLDIEIAYVFKTKFGRIRIADEHSQTFMYEQESFGGLPTLDLLDDAGLPEWRNNVSLSYTPVRGHTLKFDYKMIAGQKSDNRFGRSDDYGEFDITYIAQISKRGQLKLGVKNVSGESPPFDEFTGLNSGLYNDWGRYAFVNYRHSF